MRFLWCYSNNQKSIGVLLFQKDLSNDFAPTCSMIISFNMS
ncbi:hypothetical protein GGQ94_001597 [Petrimonas sulfuriphila]|jgi:hypothetical protein